MERDPVDPKDVARYASHLKHYHLNKGDRRVLLSDAGLASLQRYQRELVIALVTPNALIKLKEGDPGKKAMRAEERKKILRKEVREKISDTSRLENYFGKENVQMLVDLLVSEDVLNAELAQEKDNREQFIVNSSKYEGVYKDLADLQTCFLTHFRDKFLLRLVENISETQKTFNKAKIVDKIFFRDPDGIVYAAKNAIEILERLWPVRLDSGFANFFLDDLQHLMLLALKEEIITYVAHFDLGQEYIESALLRIMQICPYYSGDQYLYLRKTQLSLQNRLKDVFNSEEGEDSEKLKEGNDIAFRILKEDDLIFFKNREEEIEIDLGKARIRILSDKVNQAQWFWSCALVQVYFQNEQGEFEDYDDKKKRESSESAEFVSRRTELEKVQKLDDNYFKYDNRNYFLCNLNIYSGELCFAPYSCLTLKNNFIVLSISDVDYEKLREKILSALHDYYQDRPLDIAKIWKSECELERESEEQEEKRRLYEEEAQRLQFGEESLDYHLARKNEARERVVKQRLARMEQEKRRQEDRNVLMGRLKNKAYEILWGKNQGDIFRAVKSILKQEGREISDVELKTNMHFHGDKNGIANRTVRSFLEKIGVSPIDVARRLDPNEISKEEDSAEM